jgi:dihydroxyacid dehydratase/phosphogluconate dehydratase
MLHLARLGLLDLGAFTVSGRTLGENLEAWETSERRKLFRELLFERDGVSPDEVIFSPQRSAELGLTGTLVFPTGNLAPEGAVVKATAIDPSVLDADGVYRKTGPARVFVREKEAMAAIKDGRVQAGDVIVLVGVGPMGTGMEETYQLTGALKHLPFGKQVALVTDARFSGVSTGACIGHVGPEGLAGGPIGRVRDGDVLRIEIDGRSGKGCLDLVGADGVLFEREAGAALLAQREADPRMTPDERLPLDTRLWALLQNASGGTWGGCVYDVERVAERLVARDLGTGNAGA